MIVIYQQKIRLINYEVQVQVQTFIYQFKLFNYSSQVPNTHTPRTHQRARSQTITPRTRQVPDREPTYNVLTPTA